MDDEKDDLEPYSRIRYDEMHERWGAAVDLGVKLVVLASIIGVAFLLILK